MGKLHDELVADRVNSRPWDLIWTQPLKELMLMVKSRKTRITKANHTKKMDVSYVVAVHDSFENHGH